MTCTYKYNYKAGLSAKMCNRIFDYKTTFHISACINIYNQVDKIKREYTVYTVLTMSINRHVYCVYFVYVYTIVYTLYTQYI
jgi:hypothetical protein